MASTPPSPLTPAGLQRRVKRHVLGVPQEFMVTCAPGLEEALRGELSVFPDVARMQVVDGGVEVSAPFSFVYQANLRLRTANRVVMRIADFRARSYPELHNRARRVSWERYLGFAEDIRYQARARTSRIRHTGRIAAAVHDAVAARMQRLGRTVVESGDAGLCVHVRLHNDHCTLSVDSSGELLHRRGYRRDIVAAPMRESVAAGLLMLCGWPNSPALVDAFCGSGTFAIEAALLARRIAPGGRRSFAFEQWPSYRPAVWERHRRLAEAEALERSPVPIVCSDIHDDCVQAAHENAKRAGVLGDLTLQQGDALKLTGSVSGTHGGLCIANLPYGKRVGRVPDVLALYGRLGRHLQRHWREWDVGLVVPRGLTKALGRGQWRETARFRNGGLPAVCLCRSPLLQSEPEQ